MNPRAEEPRGGNGVAHQTEPSGDPRLARALEEYRELLEAGSAPQREAFLARHPDIAGELHDCLSGLEMIHAVAPALSGVAAERAALEEPGTGAAPGAALGDFRLVREIGRGGMGIVYEAEQLSLRRCVALKILPLAGTLDPRHLQRFHNEARAAACLHHGNIVPVFFVGCERGIHFYTMQLIDGRPLSDLIRQMRGQGEMPTESECAAMPPYPSPSRATSSTPRPAAEVTPLVGAVGHSRDYFRRVAELGVQAADALEHAHQLGIVHRDVKPGNLLVDGAGRLWVTDFGLAHVQQGGAGLTLTGQALGTPRYMSPEQALAKHVLIDHRTDIYSLGATLYELLTLRPAFESEDRQELLRQITVEEPRPPRRLNRAIPAELETIVLKAMAKSPGERYVTAAELADDLRRWLDDRPIRARPPSVQARLLRWGRRHKTFMASAAAALVMGLAVLAGSIGWVVRDQSARQAKKTADLQAALKEARQLRGEGKLPQAQAAAQRAEAYLHEGAGGPDLAGEVKALLGELAEEEADGRLTATLKKMRLRQAETDVRDNSFLLTRARPDYQEAFRSYGLGMETMTPQEAATRLRSRPPVVRATLMAALDHWLILALHEKGPEADWLGQVLSAADPDVWRRRLRAARLRNDRPELEKLAAEVDPATQPPESLFILDMGLRQRGAGASALRLLRRTQQVYPADFWVNEHLGLALQDCRPPQIEEAIRFLTVAAALQPDSPGARFNLGLALYRTGRLDEAAAAFGQAVALDADYAAAHRDLGEVFLAQGRLDEAIAACRRAAALRPDDPEPCFILGSALCNQGRLGEAVTAYRQAIKLQPDYAEVHCNLAAVLLQQGKLVQALAAYERGHDLGSRRDHWPYPSDQWVQKCRRLIELEGQLPQILRGHKQPASALERSEYAQLCFAKQYYLAAARLWADAFRADPRLAADLVAGRRDEAACAAALAADGKGADADGLDDKDRSRWRKQALQWLQDELADYRQLLESPRPKDRHLVRQRLWSWRCEQELAGLRDPAALAGLPPEERRECRQLWAAVEQVLNKMNPTP
jgi:serine/threonine protein kinase/Flp pilus assembly protein TadD